jgi:hypothetical protein
LVLDAWMKCGYVSKEQASQWTTGGNMEEFEALMVKTKHSMRSLLKLKEKPAIPEADESTQAIMGQPHSGEKMQLWAIIPGPEEPPTFLPRWMKPSVDKKISQFLATSEFWEGKLEERKLRGYTKLPPKMQSRYEEFKSMTQRRLVLHKSKQTLIERPQNLDPEDLRKNCILIELGVSAEASKLTIRAGDGASFKLVLLEMEASAETDGKASVPACLDKAPPEIGVFHEHQDAEGLALIVLYIYIYIYIVSGVLR